MPNTQVGQKIAKGLESEPTIEGAEHGGGFGQGLRWESQPLGLEEGAR
jgi:hypothetical protein